MDRNVGLFDRAARIGLGAGLLALVFTGPHAWWGLAGVLPIISAIRGNCPIYSFAGISTRPDEPDSRGRLLGL